MKSGETLIILYYKCQYLRVPLLDFRLFNKEHEKFVEGTVPLDYVTNRMKRILISPPLITIPISDIIDLDVISIESIYK